VRTFDGSAYDFPGQCHYTMITDCAERTFAIELVKNSEDYLPVDRHTGQISNVTAYNLVSVKFSLLSTLITARSCCW